MKLHLFLKDKWYLLVLILPFYLLLLLLLNVVSLEPYVIYMVFFLVFLPLSLSLGIEYIRKKSFYTNLRNNIEVLDQAYLVLETLEKPTFYEGKLTYMALYEINKSMNETVKSIESQIMDFKEYIEMWIHEVKLPISSLLLMTHNQILDKKCFLQIKRIEEAVEQVLYYVRSENAEKDYFIRKVSLYAMIHEVALKNKDDLLEQKIDFLVENVDYTINTDQKWFLFILNQIMSNSIKYRNSKVHSWIKISAKEKQDCILVSIEDNGIGIPSSDIPKVFEKTFTGQNGRGNKNSTGMGLYISKKLCQKLGHNIEIKSQFMNHTIVTITIAKNLFYDVL